LRPAKLPAWSCAPRTKALSTIARSPISNDLRWTWPDVSCRAPCQLFHDGAKSPVVRWEAMMNRRTLTGAVAAGAACRAT
jgi:hypothetical protein